MPTRNVVITEHQQDLIETLVESGRYQNASEVLREGLRLIEERDRREAAKLAALRVAVDQAWAQIDAGQYIDLEEDELEDYINMLGERAAATAASA